MDVIYDEGMIEGYLMTHPTEETERRIDPSRFADDNT